MTRLTVIYISFIVINLVFAGFSNAKINPDDIVGFWHFDEGKGDDAKDDSGKGNDGEIFGAKWADGKVNKCLEFNGEDNYVDCGNDPSLDPPHVTMAMWVWFDHIPYVHDIALNKEGKYRLIAGDFDTTHVSIRYATTSTAWGPGTAKGKTELNAEKWYHAAATYDGDKWRLYLDGKLDGEKEESGDLVSNANNVYIGLYSPPTGWPFTGFIDEVVIANTALSQQDISSLMTPYAILTVGKLATTWASIKIVP